MTNTLIKKMDMQIGAINVAVNTIEDSRSLVIKADQFLGAVVKNHIVEFFSGDTNKGLEDLLEHTHLGLSSLKKSLKANVDRINTIVEAERLEAKAEVKRLEAEKIAKAEKRKADDARARELKAIQDNDQLKAEAEAKKKHEAELVELKAKQEVVKQEAVKQEVVKAKKNLEEANDWTMRSLNGVTDNERVFIMSVVPKGAKAHAVKAVKDKLLSVKKSNPTLKWSDEALLEGGETTVKGYAVPKYLHELEDPTKADIVEARTAHSKADWKQKQENIDNGVTKKLSYEEIKEANKAKSKPIAPSQDTQCNTHLDIELNTRGGLTLASAKVITEALHDLGLNDLVINKYRAMSMATEIKKLKAEIKELSKS